MDPLASLGLGLLALVAALINGAVGYGFSSIVTPIAILWYSNKVLNPALVIVEVAVNSTLLFRERRYIRQTWARARPLVSTLFPGVLLGTIGLAYLAVNDVKVIVYATLLPLVLFQLVGFYRPLKNERRGGMAIGPGIGFLYALTTISGPPLALFLRNQGMSKNEFRCTIAQIRVAESSLTLATYFVFSTLFGSNLITLPSLSLLPILVIPVLIGIPVGTLLLRAVSPEFFRRFVMSVDAILVSYGLSRVLVSLKWVSNEVAYLAFAAAFAVIAGLSWFSLRAVNQTTEPPGELEPPEPPARWTPGEPAGPS
ncbi:MAG: sulfite exporter TauE/SafE family protein [Thermoplasmata archaeon]|nr:sulfite exporter TauE/SafE family protein [Thermoplasmata archaeon]MCI4356133.1 sulfite exporter TauE/SafE family protein [Thermoplasmata archaeon]